MVESKTVHRDSVDYWKQVTSEANELSSKHPSPRLGVFSKYLDKLPLTTGNKVLDVGIGFGRFIPTYLDRGLKVYGVDVDPAMVKDLEQSQHASVVLVQVAVAETLPHSSDFFDLVVCWGVFDELDQGSSLLEMARVTKTDGYLIITGKNNYYLDDDEEALAAEKGARKKGHPNYFTAVDSIDLQSFGLEQVALSKYARRGDFANEAELPADAANQERFYEFVLILKKNKTSKLDIDNLPEISSAFSRTFQQLQK